MSASVLQQKAAGGIRDFGKLIASIAKLHGIPIQIVDPCQITFLCEGIACPITGVLQQELPASPLQRAVSHRPEGIVEVEVEIELPAVWQDGPDKEILNIQKCGIVAAPA